MQDFKRESSIKLGGETLLLKGRFECLKEIQGHTKKSVSELINMAVDSKLPVEFIPAVIFGGLIGAGNKSFKYEQICEKVVDHGVLDLLGPVTKFFLLCVSKNPNTIEEVSAKNAEAPKEQKESPIS